MPAAKIYRKTRIGIGKEDTMDLVFYVLFAAILIGAIVWTVKGKRK
jgi:hypothetical protein